jgi:hypothetical protein
MLLIWLASPRRRRRIVWFHILNDLVCYFFFFFSSSALSLSLSLSLVAEELG